MTEIRLRLANLHPAQRVIRAGLKRFNILNCGRRFGKDIMSMNEAVYPLLEGHPVGWFAPTYKMTSENWKALRLILAPVTKRAHEQDKQIELITGGTLDMWSLDSPDVARGRKYKRVIINEAAMVKDLGYIFPTVIRPTLADLEGDALLPSTPRGLNAFFQMWQHASDDPSWARFHYTTYDNPYIKHSEIEDMRKDLPERVFRQEILAEFVEDGAYFQNVDQAAIILRPDQPEQHEGHYLVGAVDWALSGDFTVIGVACRDCNRIVDWDRFNKIDYTYQRERLYTISERWGIQGILPERNSIGVPNIEIIRERVNVLRGPDNGLGYNTTATSKPPLIQGLSTAIEHHGFKVPKEAADELRSYDVQLSTSGHPQFSAPDGSHDDWVIMLALAWHAISSVGWLFT